MPLWKKPNTSEAEMIQPWNGPVELTEAELGMVAGGNNNSTSTHVNNVRISNSPGVINVGSGSVGG